MGIVAIFIDWDNNYDFDGTYDDITADVISVKWALGMGKPYQLVSDETTCEIIVRNTSQKYSPEVSSSPIYGKILPKRQVKITATYNSTTVTLWRGWIEAVQQTWQPSGTYTGKTFARIECIGAKKMLQDVEVALELQQNKRADDIIARVLRMVTLPPAAGKFWLTGTPGYGELGVNTILGSESDYSELEQGVYTFEIYGDIREKQLASKPTGYKIINEVVEAERGFFFFRRDGKAIFWNRHHFIDDLADDDTWGLIATPGDKSTYVDYLYGIGVSNSIRVKFYPRKTDGGPITLWALNTLLSVAPGHTVNMEVLYTDTSNQPAGGFNVSTANVVYSGGALDISINGKADRADLRIVNSGTTSSALRELDVQGVASTAHNSIEVVAIDQDSIARYGKRNETKLNLTAVSDQVTAQAIADFELERRKDPRGEVAKVRFLRACNGIDNAMQLDRTIGDRVLVEMPAIGHALSYHIIGEQHEITAALAIHQTTFILQPVIIQRLAAHAETNQDTGIDLQDADAYTALAQGFQIPVAQTVGKVRLWLKKTGAPTGRLTASLYTTHTVQDGWRLGVSRLGVDTKLNSDGYVPYQQVTNATSDGVDAADVSAEYGWVSFPFSVPPELDAATDYWLMLETTDSASASNYITWGADSGGSDMKYKRAGRWNEAGVDGCFEVYAPLPGVTTYAYVTDAAGNRITDAAGNRMVAGV